jgi:hypothetical protein
MQVDVREKDELGLGKAKVVLSKLSLQREKV